MGEKYLFAGVYYLGDINDFSNGTISGEEAVHKVGLEAYVVTFDTGEERLFVGREISFPSERLEECLSAGISPKANIIEELGTHNRLRCLGLDLPEVGYVCFETE